MTIPKITSHKPLSPPGFFFEEFEDGLVFGGVCCRLAVVLHQPPASPHQKATLLRCVVGVRLQGNPQTPVDAAPYDAPLIALRDPAVLQEMDEM